MNTKNTTTQNTKSINDLTNEIIDGTNVLGGGANIGGFSNMDNEDDIILEGNGIGLSNTIKPPQLIMLCGDKNINIGRK